VYRGSAIPSLRGTYLYGDHCSSRVWSLRYDGGVLSHQADRTAEFSSRIQLITPFGQDAAGELYIVDRVGGIYRIVQNCFESESCCPASPNSAGASGTSLGFTGTSSVAANDLVLLTEGGPTDDFGVFHYGTQQIAVPFGDGMRCVGGLTYRLFPVVQASASGQSSLSVDLTSPPEPAGQISVGESWNFQYWYRDPLGPGGAGFNLSAALRLIFCP